MTKEINKYQENNSKSDEENKIKGTGMVECIGENVKEQREIDNIATKIMEEQVIQQCIDMQVMQEFNNGCYDTCEMKTLDLEEELEVKDKACKELEEACKETLLYHQNKYVTLKKKFVQNKELLKKRKAKKVHFSTRKAS